MNIQGRENESSPAHIKRGGDRKCHYRKERSWLSLPEDRRKNAAIMGSREKKGSLLPNGTEWRHMAGIPEQSETMLDSGGKLSG